ncbi:TetR/AcrR family transcriptional regulator [Glaciihabitans sp. UYNi722]|uniref:TetR/AcrR family transcriptional regulator n=1 Tax=Glaciihabitans sp. UYNi722 TaxID=3156344 RepID=UPI003398F25B
MLHNRAAMVESAAVLLRSDGPAGVTVDAVSSRANLTHGSFYKHFDSKEALIVEALSAAVEQRRTAMKAREAAPDGDTLPAFAMAYLSRGQRDHPGDGCVAAALAGAVASDPAGPLGEGFRTAVDDLVAAVQTRRPHADEKDVLADVALMVGSLELSRATRGTNRSDKFLDAALERLMHS